MADKPGRQTLRRHCTSGKASNAAESPPCEILTCPLLLSNLNAMLQG